jgi:hypothetical protein
VVQLFRKDIQQTFYPTPTISTQALVDWFKTKTTIEDYIISLSGIFLSSEVAFMSDYEILKAINGVKDSIPSLSDILEPAAGNGHISSVLQTNGFEVESYDLYDYSGVEEPKTKVKTGVDFLKTDFRKYDWVVTNPPYSKDLLMPFVKKSLNIAKKGVAMFLKGTFLESNTRADFFKESGQLRYILIFSKKATRCEKWVRF